MPVVCDGLRNPARQVSIVPIIILKYKAMSFSTTDFRSFQFMPAWNNGEVGRHVQSRVAQDLARDLAHVPRENMAAPSAQTSPTHSRSLRNAMTSHVLVRNFHDMVKDNKYIK